MGKLTKAAVEMLMGRLADAGFGDDVVWSENAGPPADADEFASEAIFVICNSGMKNTVARRIYERVMVALEAGKPARDAFGHKGKAMAIGTIWLNRAILFDAYMKLRTDDERLEWIAHLPWIGGITKYHLAKNFGVDVAKPDVHLQRLADHHGEAVQDLCERLGRETGLKARTIDLILWRACAEGMIDTRRLRGAGLSTGASDE